MLYLLQPLLQQSRAQKRGRKGKVKPVFVSRQLEVKYRTELRAISRICQQSVDDILLPALKPQVGDSTHHVADGLLSRAQNALKAARDSVINQVTDYATEKLAETIVKRQQQISDKQLAENIKMSTGIDLYGLMQGESLEDAVNEAVAANVSLIKSIPDQYFNSVQAAVLSGIQEGKSIAEITKAVKKLGNSTDARAELIAQDQLGKINGRLTQLRQQKMGITHYYWATSRDERVRHSHRLRNGRLFAWDKPPDDGHPGIPIRCRCTAIPYIAHLIDPTAPKPEEIMARQTANDELMRKAS